MANIEMGDGEHGLDEAWLTEETDDWVNLEVLGPCEQVAEQFRQAMDGLADQVIDCRDGNAKWPEGEWERAILIYQLQGSRWTHIHSFGNRVADYPLPTMTKVMATKAVAYWLSDSTGAFGFELYDSGESVEALQCGDSGRERDKLEAEGWSLNEEGDLQFRSSRGKTLDLDSSDFVRYPIQFAREIGLAVPHGVWTLDDESDSFVLGDSWSAADLQGAKLLWTRW